MRKTKKLPNKFYETKPLIRIANSLDLYDHSFRTGEYGLYQGRPGQRMEERVKYKVGIYIFAPELAREFAYSRGIEFYSDIEHHSWRLNFFI
ncbi:hypothetical protein [Orientia tsutsugamushi]|uniref:Uncharacterized protein n=1 Tax=Orientia tsutsugamushi (strain Boryong) TaxID=357244 RepID=A5CDG2_ORITB|nr:hypothetical protein [Orientia tsutsugamushi]CAM79888.1 hypothetical protein OTBS_0822 [Orientia tsutsugamushi str. Boryong]